MPDKNPDAGPSGQTVPDLLRHTTPPGLKNWGRLALFAALAIAAAGILGCPLSYCTLPVCGVRKPIGPTDRTRLATAPYCAATRAPEVRYVTVSE